MPNFQFNGLVVLEEFLHKLYLEYQAEVVGVVVWLTLFARTHTGNLYQLQVTDTLLLNIWHEIIEFVQSHR